MGTLKALLLGSAVLLFAGAACMAQKDGATGREPDALGPAFEVATIRPANRDDGRRWYGMRYDASGRFQASAVSLGSLVSMAYSVPPNRLKVTIDRAAPKWVDSDSFDIQAKVDDGYLGGWDKLSEEERREVIQPMLRRLLAERFHVKLGVETRQTPVYALVQAKGGAHVSEVPAPAPVQGDAFEAQARWEEENPGKVYPGSIQCSGDKCTAHAVRIGGALGQIAANSQADRMVIDETGLKGYYDLSFSFPSEKDGSPMQVVGDELGMKFVPRTVPVKTYVIQWAERPSVDGAEVERTIPDRRRPRLDAHLKLPFLSKLVYRAVTG